MNNEKHFRDQKLDSQDYTAEEGRAEVVRNGGGLLTALESAVVGRKLILKIVKGIGKITKV